jgi:dienelactone hydrolase
LNGLTIFNTGSINRVGIRFSPELGYISDMKCIPVILLMFSLPLCGAIRTQTIEYQHEGKVLEGFLAYDDVLQGKRLAVLIVHQWMGLTDYEKKRAEMLAQLGFNVFAVDVYGKDSRPKDSKEAGALAGKFKNNRELFRERIRAGLVVLQKHELTDPKRVAAIGYCFGGTGVIELARSGADVTGVVSFHGGLDSLNPSDGKNIKCKVLALHGADDPHVSAQDLSAFESEMRDAKVDWELIKYGGAVHAFTDWNAGNDPSKGAAYNERADKRSWEAMKQFFGELYK